MKKFFLFLLTVVFSTSLFAQSSGYIKYEVVDVITSNEELAPMVGMFKNTVQEIYFSEKVQRMDVEMMGGMSKVKTLMDMGKKEGFMLMDMMGRRVKINMSEEDLDFGNEDDGTVTELPDMKFTEFKDDTRDILGFKCHRVDTEIEQEGMKMTLTAYVTPKIKAPASVIENVKSMPFTGTPLEFIISMPGMDISLDYKATDYKEEVPADAFNLSTQGYQEMTMEEFQQSMGGMGGF